MFKLNHWRFWEWKSIGITILIFGLLIGALLYTKFFPSYQRNAHLENLSGRTYGLTYHIEKVQEMSMDFEGNKITIRGYNIMYNYKVDSLNYIGEDYLRNSIENHKFLKRIHQKLPVIIRIAYDPKNPQNAQIIEN